MAELTPEARVVFIILGIIALVGASIAVANSVITTYNTTYNVTNISTNYYNITNVTNISNTVYNITNVTNITNEYYNITNVTNISDYNYYYNVTNVTNITTNITNNITNNITSNNITGTGNAGNISYWTNSTNLDSSPIVYSGGYLGFFKTNPLYPIDMYALPPATVSSQFGTSGLSIYMKSSLGGNTTYSGTLGFGGSGGVTYIYGGDGGYPTGTLTNTAQGGSGGGVVLQGGTGASVTTTATTGTGGGGGSITILGGNGGLGTGATNSNAGTGGSVTLTSGQGQSAYSGNVSGGSGGNLNLNSGVAGQGFGTGHGGSGGSWVLSAGSGGNGGNVAGASLNGTGGNAGTITISSGSGGVSGGGLHSKNGGNTRIYSGAGGSTFTADSNGGNGGYLLLEAGAGGQNNYGGNAGNGSSVYIAAGKKATLGNNTNDGDIYLGYDIIYGASYGNIAIGLKTTPQAKVHQDSGTATATYHKFTAGTTTGTTATSGFDVGINAAGEAQLRQYGDTNLTFYTNNSEWMRLTNIGYLGINTTAPNQALQVVGNVNATAYYGDGEYLSNLPIGDNTSWNESYANTLYYPLNNNIFGYYNVSTLPAQINYYDNITNLQISNASAWIVLSGAYTNITALQSLTPLVYTNITSLQTSMESLVLNVSSLQNYSADRVAIYTNITSLQTNMQTAVLNYTSLGNYSQDKVAIYNNISAKANTASPTFTGTVTVPVLTVTTNITQTGIGSGALVCIYGDNNGCIIKANSTCRVLYSPDGLTAMKVANNGTVC